MTFKDIFIRKIRQVPDDILQEVYVLDVVDSKGILQWNSHLADKYKDQKIESDEEWLRFEIGDWRISMETENELL